MAGNNKVDSVEKDKRVYQVALMLRRKPIPFIVDYIKREWGLERTQAYNYIKEAKNEWKKYLTNVKRWGMGYYISQLRDLKDQAYSRKVIMGRGDNKDTVTIADLNLVFEITKEEAKLMGIYPADKSEIDVTHKGLDYEEYKRIKGMTKDERAAFISELREIIRCGSNGNIRAGKGSDKKGPMAIKEDNIPKL